MLPILAIDHVGVRVADLARSEAFYVALGFAVAARWPEHHVSILRHAAGIELNLIANAVMAFDGSNVLMDDDLPKRAGYTHVALRVASIEATLAALGALGVPIAEGPVALGDGVAVFVRDPDRNVIELRCPTP